MNRACLFGVVLGVLMSSAQAGEPSAPPVQPPAPTSYKIEFTTAELDLVGKALVKLPYEDVATLLNSLRKQVLSQQGGVEDKPK